MPRSPLQLAFVAAIALVATSDLRADFTCNIAGNLGADLPGTALGGNDPTVVTTGLAGGSFSGSYTTSSFSNANTVDLLSSFKVNLYGATGNLVFSFVSGTMGYSGYFIPTAYGPNSGNLEFSYDPPGPVADIPRFFLELNFASLINGVGQANPYSPTAMNNARSLLGYVFHPVSVISASSSVSIPTPPSLILAGGMSLIGLGSTGVRGLRLLVGGRRGRVG